MGSVAAAEGRASPASIDAAPGAPLSPEAQSAVQSVLGFLRARPADVDRPLVALALEVSRTPDLVADALASTGAGESGRVRSDLEEHVRHLVELRAAAAAESETLGADRAALVRAGPQLDELLAHLERAARTGDAAARAQELEALERRMQSGELPVRQVDADLRAPTVIWFQGGPEIDEDEAAGAGSSRVDAEGRGE